MYRKIDSLSQPDEDTILWRYMDFTAFVFLLESHCLHFTRPDQFHDPFEGAICKKRLDKLKSFYSDFHLGCHAPPIRKIEEFRRMSVANCWHMNPHESQAMWRMYLKSDEGIAIKTTALRLANCLGHDDDYTYHIGCVKYIDYEEDDMEGSTVLNGLFYKRKSYEYEKEVRVLAIHNLFLEDSEGEKYLAGIARIEFPKDGLDVEVNISTLIQEIYVSPAQPAWVRKLVESLVKKYSLDATVRQSSLDAEPLW